VAAKELLDLVADYAIGEDSAVDGKNEAERDD
jgi:hypothetical protein